MRAVALPILVLGLGVAALDPRNASPAGSACAPGSESSAVSVLIAAQVIRNETTWSSIVSRRMAKTYSLPCAEVEPGAFGTLAELRGLVAALDIFPGQQLTRV